MSLLSYSTIIFEASPWASLITGRFIALGASCAHLSCSFTMGNYRVAHRLHTTLSKTGAPEIETAVRSQSTLRQSVSQLCAFCLCRIGRNRSLSLHSPAPSTLLTTPPVLLCQRTAESGSVESARVGPTDAGPRRARAQTAHPRSPAVPATRPRAAAGPPRPSSAPSLPRPERRAARFDSTLHLTPGTRRVATQAGLVSAVYNTYGICVWSN